MATNDVRLFRPLQHFLGLTIVLPQNGVYYYSSRHVRKQRKKDISQSNISFYVIPLSYPIFAFSFGCYFVSHAKWVNCSFALQLGAKAEPDNRAV